MAGDRGHGLRRARSWAGRWSCRPTRRSSRSGLKIAVESSCGLINPAAPAGPMSRTLRAPCAGAEGRIKSELAAVETAAGRGDRRCFWSAARRSSTSSWKARTARRRRPTPRGPGARPSTWRSGWRGWGRGSGLLTGLSSDLLGQRLRRCWRRRGCRRRYAIPTDRPTTLSLVGLDAAGVPAYQFYDNGSADTGVEPADLPALGPEVVGAAFRLLLARGGAGRRRDGGAGPGEPGRFVSVDPERAADGRARHGRLAGADGGALPAGRSRQDQRRGPRAALARQAGRGAGRRPDRGGRRAWWW